MQFTVRYLKRLNRWIKFIIGRSYYKERKGRKSFRKFYYWKDWF
jgi:hypothetical protein